MIINKIQACLFLGWSVHQSYFLLSRKQIAACIGYIYDVVAYYLGESVASESVASEYCETMAKILWIHS